MKKYYINSFCLFILLLTFLSCKKDIDTIETSTNSLLADNSFQQKIDTIKNKYKVSTKENIVEIHHQFILRNKREDLVGGVIALDLSKSSGAMLSAYSKANENYEIYFRVDNGASWSDWIKMKENNEVKNPKRKVYLPTNLENTVKNIQFRSDEIISKEVVFRIYKFKK
jgi:hypothetical protein